MLASDRDRLAGDRLAGERLDRLPVYERSDPELRFGRSVSLPYVFVNHAGTKALIIENERWRGSTNELNKTEKGWEVKLLHFWIS